MHLFAGNSNLPLSLRIAGKLGIKLSKVEINRFSDGECRVWIREEVKGEKTFVIQSLSFPPDQYLMELCLLGSALKRLEAKNITAIIPWLGYSKQDREFRKGEAVSIELVAKLLETAGFEKIIAVELHSQTVKEYFKIPIIELSAKELVKKIILQKKENDFIVISPDLGGKGRSCEFARIMQWPIAYLNKKRDYSDGKVIILDIDREIKGREVIIYDDIINTGATAVETANFLQKKGAKRIIFIGVHSVLSGNAGILLQNSFIDEVITTDTIDLSKEKQFSKLKIISVDDLLTEKLRNLS